MKTRKEIITEDSFKLLNGTVWENRRYLLIKKKKKLDIYLWSHLSKNPLGFPLTIQKGLLAMPHV